MSLPLAQSWLMVDHERQELDNPNFAKATTRGFDLLMLMLFIRAWIRFTGWSNDETDPIDN